MTAPLPRRIAWFAPWTWKRRWKALAVAALLFGYPLSFGPAFGLFSVGLFPHSVLVWFYHPMWVLRNTSSDLAVLIDWYMRLFMF